MPRFSQRLPPAAVVVGGIALLVGVVALYTRTERQVIERHNEHQLLMVQAVASGLGKDIERRLDTFAAAALKMPSAGLAVPAELRSVLEASGFQDAELQPSRIPARGQVLTGQAVLGEQGILLPVAIPVSGDRTLRAVLPFRSFGPFIEGWNRKVGGRLWLLDDGGRLIYSKLHENMLGRSALGGDPGCLACHSSFQMEAAMVAGASRVVPHQVGMRPSQLVFFAPVEFAGRHWSLAMSDPEAEVTELTRRGFLQASTLTALFLLLIIMSGLALIRVYRQKLEAERRVAIAENRARLEARLARAEQLAAVGKMTAQIAHEINTPLASISLNVTYVLSEVERQACPLAPEVREAADEIQREVERLKSFTGECLKLTRIHSPYLQPLQLTSVVRAFLGFISREAKRRNVELHAAFDNQPVHVRGDGDLLRQALLNLARNAFDAMPGGGRLEITLFRRDGTAELAIEDSGPGVPEEQREKIFDAFFTTKTEGTGLGLAVVRRIVEQHGGRAEYTPAGAGGARFVVRLPLLPAEDGAGAGARPAGEAATDSLRGPQGVVEVRSNG